MKKIVALACTLLCVHLVYSQGDYYDPEDSLTIHKDVEKEVKKTPCHCSATEGSSIWSDIWETGIKGTIKGVWQSTTKPLLIGQAVGGVQEASETALGPTLAATTTSTLAISEVNKSRKHHRKHKKKNNEFCNCLECPYHGNRYHPNQGITP